MTKYIIRAPENRPAAVTYSDWLRDPRGDIRVFTQDGKERKEVRSVKFNGNPTKTVCFGVVIQAVSEKSTRIFEEVVELEDCTLEGDWRNCPDRPLFEKVIFPPSEPITLKAGDIARKQDGTPA